MNRFKKGLATFVAVAAAASALTVAPLAADSRAEQQTDIRGYFIQLLRQETGKALRQMLQDLLNGTCNYPQLPPQWNPEDCPELPENPDVPEIPEVPEQPGTPETPEEPDLPEEPEQPDLPESSEPDTDLPENSWPDFEWPDMEWPDNSQPDGEIPGEDGSTPDDEESGTPDSLPAYAREVVELVNQERIKAGLEPLEVDLKVQQAAQVRAEEIKRSFSHTRPNGSSPFTALSEAGASYRGAGENIAMGQKSPADVMNSWMNSSGHRANSLNSSFTHIGVGVYESGGRIYWTQLFTY